MQIVKKFKNWLATDGKSDKTLESYVGDVGGFISWINCHDNFTFKTKLERGQVTAYCRYLVEEDYAVSTINKKVNSLRAFNEFLIEQEIIEEMVVEPSTDRIKIASGSGDQVEVFTEEEVEEILAYIKNKDVSSRKKMIVHLLLYTGIRVTELVNIKLKDIDLLARELKIMGKGGKYREVPLNAKVVKAIQEYTDGERKDHKHSDSEYLILTQRSPKCHRDTINNLLNNMGEELDIKMYPHKFRHTTFTMLLKKGVEITVVSELAGHASIETTHRYYLNTSREEKMEAVSLL